MPRTAGSSSRLLASTSWVRTAPRASTTRARNGSLGPGTATTRAIPAAVTARSSAGTASRTDGGSGAASP